MAPSEIISESITVTGLSLVVQVVAEVMVPPCWSCAETVVWVRRKVESETKKREYSRILDIIDIPRKICDRKIDEVPRMKKE